MNKRGMSAMIGVIGTLVITLIVLGLGTYFFGWNVPFLTDLFAKNNVQTMIQTCSRYCDLDEWSFCNQPVEIRVDSKNKLLKTCNELSMIPGNEKNKFGGLIAVCFKAPCYKGANGDTCIEDFQCVSKYCDKDTNTCKDKPSTGGTVNPGSGRGIDVEQKEIENVLQGKYSDGTIGTPGEGLTDQQIEDIIKNPKELKISEETPYSHLPLITEYKNSVAGEKTLLVLSHKSSYMGVPQNPARYSKKWKEYFLVINQNPQLVDTGNNLIILKKPTQIPDYTFDEDSKSYTFGQIEIVYDLPSLVGKDIIFQFYVKDDMGEWFMVQNRIITTYSPPINSRNDLLVLSTIMNQIPQMTSPNKILEFDTSTKSWNRVNLECFCDKDKLTFSPDLIPSNFFVINGKKYSPLTDCSFYAGQILGATKYKSEMEPLLLLAIMIKESKCDVDSSLSSGGLMGIKGSSLSGGVSLEEIDERDESGNNIFAASEILKSTFDLYQKGILSSSSYTAGTESFKSSINECIYTKGYLRYKYYKGWNAALRGYDEWSCKVSDGINDKYVEEVMSIYGQLVNLYDNYKGIPALTSEMSRNGLSPSN